MLAFVKFVKKYLIFGGVVVLVAATYWMVTRSSQHKNGKGQNVAAVSQDKQNVNQHPPAGVSHNNQTVLSSHVSGAQKKAVLRVARRFAVSYARFLSKKRVRKFPGVTATLQAQLRAYQPRFTPVKRVAQVNNVTFTQVHRTRAVVRVVIRWSDGIQTTTPVGLIRDGGRWFVNEVGEGR